MKTMTALLILTTTLGLVGCGGKPTGSPPPLSVADWKAMPVDQKYTPETLERLKQGDPKLQTAEGWDVFSRTILPESRKKDFPRGTRKP